MANTGGSIRKAIIALREHFNMSQEDLARKGCMTLDEIKEIESSSKSIPFSSFEFECIAEAFNLTRQDLISCVDNTQRFFKERFNVSVAA